MNTIPEYSILRFLDFLDYRGVIRTPWTKEKGRNRTSNETNAFIGLMWGADLTDQETAADNSYSDSSSVLSQENNIANFIPRGGQTIACDVGSNPKNPDLFYSRSDGTKEVDIPVADDDSFYKYVSLGMASDRRYSNNSERQPKTLFRKIEEEAFTARDAYRTWERYDPVTRKEVFADEDETALESIDIKTMNNGGLYEPFRPGLSEIATGGSEQLLQLPPAAKYRDLLSLSYMGATTVCGLECSRRYKNNLSVVMQDGVGEDLFFTSCRSEILVYKFDARLHLPKKNAALRFDTRPPFTSTADRIILTWPYYPHTINFIKFSRKWMNGAVVGVCMDDGSVLIWNVETLRNEIKKISKARQNTQSDSRLYCLRIAADTSLKLDSSAWGLDFASTKDESGEQHYAIVASSNSQTITLFYFDRESSNFSVVNSHQLAHNIPDVSVLEYKITEGQHTIDVSCASISGELVLFRFSFAIDEYSVLVTADSQWPMRLGRVLFDEPRVVRRTSLNSDCWTTKPIKTHYFKPVQSIRAMTGDPFIDEGKEISQILSESKILDLYPDLLKSKDLGGAAYWQFFDSPVVYLASSENSSHQAGETSKFSSNDEEYRRIHQAYKHCCKFGSLATLSLNDVVLVVSTGSRLGLFRADTLLCTSATKEVFTLDVPACNETKWCKRILITHVIEELLCFIAVTQLGLVTIMRLCEHRGLYGMRQEHLFPNAMSLTIAESTLRTIIGLAVRDMSVTNGSLRFLLYISYSDGLILTYELRETSDDLIDTNF